MPYAIMRFEKRKGGPATAIEKHHERKKERYGSNPDIDRERSYLNYHLIEPRLQYYGEIQTRIEKAQKENPKLKVRKDSVKFIDTIITAMRELLSAQKARQEVYRKQFGKSYCQDYTDYVCVDPMGGLFRPNYITDHFSILLRQHGLRHIRFHDLRHSCASLLLSQGVPMKQIQDWLGHSTFATTADIYSHLDYNSKQVSADAIAAAFSPQETDSSAEPNL